MAATPGELTYVAQSELGAMLCKVDPLDNMETEDELEGMGVNVTIGGGVDYQLFEKVQVGVALWSELAPLV